MKNVNPTDKKPSNSRTSRTVCSKKPNEIYVTAQIVDGKITHLYATTERFYRGVKGRIVSAIVKLDDPNGSIV